MWGFFSDPVLRAPFLASILMGFATALIGCLVFLQKRSLVGETLSHAAYPGVVVSVIIASALFPFSEGAVALSIMIGASIFSGLGLLSLGILENRLKVSSDAALCFVLSVFFGLGILIASRVQVTHALWFSQIQVFLFGQAATLLDSHILVFGLVATGVVLAITLLFQYLQIHGFDPGFARSVSLPVKRVEAIISALLILAIVVGMRSVGVILMSALLIAPAVAARQWTRSLATFFALAGCFGAFAGYMGNALSVWFSQPGLPLATGPMIVLTATALAALSLLFAPRKGLVTRGLRMSRFKFQCRQENILKALYKKQPVKIPFWVQFVMERKGWLDGEELTEKGSYQGEKLVRLHRLWEVYLVHMGQEKERVHHSAEVMEHILTDEMEKELEALLGHPTVDPHKQPIPQGRGS